MALPGLDRLRTVAVSVLMVAVTVFVSLTVVEAALRIVRPSQYAIWPPGLERRFTPDSVRMPGVFGLTDFRVNSLGLRADEPTDADAYRILTIGGSTTECLYLDQGETWPQLLQVALNARGTGPHTWVGNGGKSGQNSRHHVLAMRYLPLEAMKINTVVVLVGINDLASRLAQGDAYNTHALQDSAALRQLMAETFQTRPGGDPDEPWFKRTVIWQLLRGARSRWTAATPSTTTLQDASGGVYDVWRRHRAEARTLLTELPDLRGSLDEYARNLREVAQLARERKVRLVLMPQPTLWRTDLPPELTRLLWYGGVGDFMVRPNQPYYAVGALIEGMQRYNDVVRQTCEREQVECLDLTMSLAKDASVFYDDVHYNEAGARQVATRVADYLASRAPFTGAR